MVKLKKKVVFVTTGDIKNIATAKRALGLANPLSELGWSVSILMEDTVENRHRVSLECNEQINVYYFPRLSVVNEIIYKNKLIKEIKPDYLYICAFVTRNIVGIWHRCKKLVEHSELQSGIPDMKGLRRYFCYLYEFYSIIYADALLNASMYLQKVYTKRAKKLGQSKVPMLYFPYAYNPTIVRVKDIDYNDKRFKRFNNKRNFVFLGSITKNYGAYTILEAVKILKDKYSNFQMLMLGRGRHYDDAKRFIAENNLCDYVFMPGFVEEEEISDYFSIADAFISPMNDTVQDRARCPSKIYLYLPYQKPIITCKIGEPYETLKNSGMYFEPANSVDLSCQMEKVIVQKIENKDINPMDFSWSARAIELDDWIKIIRSRNGK